MRTADGIAHLLTDRPIRNGSGWLTLCPCHGDKRPSLSIRDGEAGKILVHCFAGCDPREVLKTLREMGLLDGENTTRPIPSPEPSRRRAALFNHLWSEARPIARSGIVDIYLTSRGIVLQEWPCDLREHPSFAVYEDGKRTGQAFPALLCVIRNGEGQQAGLHVTFLKQDGREKSAIGSPRRIIGIKEGSTRGGCIRLMEPASGHIGLGEGVETTLSASILTGIPGWAALTAGGIERAQLPSEIRCVTIFADRDRAGLTAAANACERFRKEGRKSEILAPDGRGMDFNEVLKKENARTVSG